MLVTAWVGMFLASPTVIPWRALVFGTIGIACAASAAAIVNHLMDRHIDRHMIRTALRPIAAGRINPPHALLFALFLASIAGIVLNYYVNQTTAILTFATFIGYAVIYTMYLKRATPQNIVIGGLSGAMPPLLGWASVSGDINPYGVLLVLIIFAWTPPHFWALALYRTADYAAANIPMLPVTHGKKFTKLCLLLYTFLLVAVSCLPFVVKLAGFTYFIIAITLGIIFLYLAIRLYNTNATEENKYSLRTFKYSIVYLFILFSVLLLDNRHGVVE
jgi:protoheme IX farnesyltransferase